MAGNLIQPPEVIRELRRFLIEKGAVRAPDIDEVARDYTTEADACEFLNYLEVADYLTDRQRERFEEAFRDHQKEEAETVLEMAFERGLLSESDVEEVRQEFGQVLFATTIGEYLLEAGYITRGQAETLMPDSREPVHPDQQRTTSEADVGETSGRSLSGIVSDVAEALPDAPGSVTQPQMLVGIAVTGFLGFGCVIALAMGLGGTNYIEPECKMNGHGEGECTFTNTTNAVGSGCGEILAYCDNEIHNSRTSATFCSGEIEPNVSRTISFDVAGFDQVSPDYGDWRESCDFMFVSERDE